MGSCVCVLVDGYDGKGVTIDTAEEGYLCVVKRHTYTAFKHKYTKTQNTKLQKTNAKFKNTKYKSIKIQKHTNTKTQTFHVG